MKAVPVMHELKRALSVKGRQFMVLLRSAIGLGSQVLVAVAVMAAASADAARADPAEGARIAEQWCSSCHAMGAGRNTTPDVAPPFTAMANELAFSRERITGFLWSPHPPMPQLDLTPAQVNSLADYIDSLRRP
jgi:mono/diheme cytochrome c family protein